MSQILQKTLMQPTAEEFIEFFESCGESILPLKAKALVGVFQEVVRQNKPLVRYHHGKLKFFGMFFTRSTVLVYAGGEKEVRNRMPDRQKQRGFSLIEILLAIFIAVLIGLAAVLMLNSRAVGIGDKEITAAAENAAAEALTALAATAGRLPLGGTFERTDDGRIRVQTRCSPEFCDFVTLPMTAEMSRNSAAKGIPYGKGSSPPIVVDTQIDTVPGSDTESSKFLRRWRIEEIGGEYKLRRLTVAVLKDEDAIEPLVIEETVVAVD